MPFFSINEFMSDLCFYWPCLQSEEPQAPFLLVAKVFFHNWTEMSTCLISAAYLHVFCLHGTVECAFINTADLFTSFPCKPAASFAFLKPAVLLNLATFRSGADRLETSDSLGSLDMKQPELHKVQVSHWHQWWECESWCSSDWLFINHA